VAAVGAPAALEAALVPDAVLVLGVAPGLGAALVLDPLPGAGAGNGDEPPNNWASARGVALTRVNPAESSASRAVRRLVRRRVTLWAPRDEWMVRG
jgi:hypothetical protein